MAGEYLLGLDIGSSSIKACLVDVSTGNSIVQAQSPAEEMAIDSPKPGWAEQNPEDWWTHAVLSTRECLMKSGIQPSGVRAIGVSYQMHGLVIVDKDHRPLRPSIIWCDSRAVSYGDKAYHDLGESYCKSHLLNSPGNFTASKLKWVREHEPAVFQRIHKFMLPGDYIAMKLTGEIQTTSTGLSEGIMWDFREQMASRRLMDYYGIDPSTLASQVAVFSVQGQLRAEAARELGLPAGVKIAYRAGDQPNNAFSLNVLNPGESAATAGTSGVIYGVTDQLACDEYSRVNTFVHVTNGDVTRNGILLCINGTGILYNWLRKNIRSEAAYAYEKMNEIASGVPVGCDGLVMMPFGNGAERILRNADVGASIHGLDFNRHTQAHLFRAAQEGIVFSLAYGLEMLEKMGSPTHVIRAGNSNMFQSPIFRDAFINSTNSRLELYNTNGAIGAALGAGVGCGIYSSFQDAFRGLTLLDAFEPAEHMKEQYGAAFAKWKSVLARQIESHER